MENEITSIGNMLTICDLINGSHLFYFFFEIKNKILSSDKLQLSAQYLRIILLVVT